MRRLLLFLLLAFAFIGSVAHAQGTYTASSCAYHDVNACINNDSSGSCSPSRHTAVDGDTVIIPSCPSMTPGGANTWTNTGLSIGAAITLQGQGVGNTVLIDDNPKGGAGCSGPVPLITVRSSSTAAWRLTGFTVWAETTDSGFCSAHITTASGSHAFRIDHIEFDDDGKNGSTGGVDAIGPDGDLWGVIDHVTCYNSRRRCVLAHATTFGGSQGRGDNSWATPDSMGAPGTVANGFGSASAIYMENNTCNQSQPNTGSNCFACEWGARCVIRSSTMSTIGSHGPETANQGVRQMEVYNNTFNMTGTSMGLAVNIRSGTGMVFNNAVTTNAYDVMLNWAYYRCNTQACATNQEGGAAPWGMCNGTSSWDFMPSSVPYPCLNGIGRGQGILINRSAAAWPKEALDPIYSWNNNLNGTIDQAVDASPVGGPAQFTPNRDYYNGIGGVGNGTVGVGYGTLAGRPSTCTTGVGYWATDQGDWNQSGSGGQGELFVCTITNTWTLYYVPYTYPHPLTKGTVAAGPAPPTSLSAVVN